MSALRFRSGLAVALCLLAGCSSLGPRTVPRDRFDYSSSISESWKRQFLLNIVRMRYLDPPTFVDVGQIVSGYTLETALTAGGSLPENASFGGSTVTLGGSARYTDRPTITYTPLTGTKFIKSLMTPLPPDAVFFTIQSGWPADAVILVSVAAMNGLKNQESSLIGVNPPDPKFLRALELLRKIQASGAVGLRVQQEAQKQQSTLLTFRASDVSDETLADIRELRGLLKLDLDAPELKLVFGATSSTNRELAVLTRSLLHIMSTLASQVEVPPEDVTQGRAMPGFDPTTPAAQRTRLIRIQSSHSKPGDSYVEVPYRSRWYWIDDRDLRSKRVFAFMMMLFTLADTGEKENLPLITIPAQ